MQDYLDTLKLFYTDSGREEGTPVVMIHAFPFSHSMWLPQVEVLNERFRVITYDVRGLGKSAQGTGELTIDLRGDDLFGLLDALGIERAVVVGLSMGGYIALRAHERAPERFLALVLCDTKSAADDEAAREGRSKAIALIESEGLAVFAEDFVERVFAPQTFTARAQVVEHHRGVIESHDPRGVIGALRALASRPDTTRSLATIAVPTLLLFGEEDALTPPALGREMEARIAGSEMALIPMAAHLSNLDNPEAFNERLSEFLERIGREGKI